MYCSTQPPHFQSLLDVSALSKRCFSSVRRSSVKTDPLIFSFQRVSNSQSLLRPSSCTLVIWTAQTKSLILPTDVDVLSVCRRVATKGDFGDALNTHFAMTLRRAGPAGRAVHCCAPGDDDARDHVHLPLAAYPACMLLDVSIDVFVPEALLYVLVPRVHHIHHHVALRSRDIRVSHTLQTHHQKKRQVHLTSVYLVDLQLKSTSCTTADVNRCAGKGRC